MIIKEFVKEKSIFMCVEKNKKIAFVCFAGRDGGFNLGTRRGNLRESFGVQ